MSPKRTAWWLTGIVAVALILRLWAIFVLLPKREYTPSYDAFQYNMLARSIVEGRGFAWPPGGNRHGFWALPEGPTSTRAPLYPAFIAVIYKLCGEDNYTAVRIAQAVLGALLCLIVYAIGTLWSSPRLGLLAAGMTAIYPPFIQFSYFGGPGRLLSEGLFMFLLAAALWQISRLVRDVTNRRAALGGGVLLGLSALARPIPTLFPGVLLVWTLFVPRPERRPWLRAVGLITIAFILTLVPWAIRNYQVHHRFVLISTDQGHSFLLGNNEFARGGAVEMHEVIKPKEIDPEGNLPEAERYHRLTLLGLKFWREHPEKLPKLFVRKILMLWNFYELRYNLWYGMLLPWVFLGILVMWRGPNPLVHRLLIGTLLYATFVTVLTVGTTRCRYPFEPYLILFAAAGLAWWFQRSSLKWAAASAIMGGVAVNALLYQYSDQFLQFMRGTFQLVGLR